MGLDVSPKMIEIARKNVKYVDFQVGSFSNMPYKKGSFDIVVASLVMHYSNNLDRSFREVRRILKNGGVFIFSSDNPVTHMTERGKGKPRYYRIFGNYFKEEKVYARWGSFDLNCMMPYQHITFQTWIRTIIRNGFTIEDYIDAKPLKIAKKIDKERYTLLSRVPWFFVIKVRKC